jgi:pre-mRNA-splicing factor SYF1
MASQLQKTLTPHEVQFEEGILRNPFNLKIWLAYLEAMHDAKHAARYLIFERALSFLPRSYKLWHAYLQERTYHIRNRSVADNAYAVLINTFERSLVQMHKMPRIW